MSVKWNRPTQSTGSITKGGPQVWWILLQLLLTTSAWPCLNMAEIQIQNSNMKEFFCTTLWGKICSGGTWVISSLNDLRGRYNVHSVEVPYIPYHLLIKIHRRGASRLVQLPFCKLRFCQTKAPTRKADRESEGRGLGRSQKNHCTTKCNRKIHQRWRS